MLVTVSATWAATSLLAASRAATSFCRRRINGVTTPAVSATIPTRATTIHGE